MTETIGFKSPEFQADFEIEKQKAFDYVCAEIRRNNDDAGQSFSFGLALLYACLPVILAGAGEHEGEGLVLLAWRDTIAKNNRLN